MRPVLHTQKHGWRLRCAASLLRFARQPCFCVCSTWPHVTSRLLGSRASVAVFDARAARRERAEKLVWAARFPRASYPTACGQKFRARRRSRRQKSSFSARLLRQPLTAERRSHAMGRPHQHGRALPDHALGRSLCYWRRFWWCERHRRERADVLEPPKNGFLARRPQSSCSTRWSETRWT